MFKFLLTMLFTACCFALDEKALSAGGFAHSPAFMCKYTVFKKVIMFKVVKQEKLIAHALI